MLPALEQIHRVTGAPDAIVFIVFLMRVAGKRELSSMEPSDIVLLVVIGDLVQDGVTQSDYSVTGIVLAAGTIGLLATATAYLTYRFKRIRSVVEGEPVILVENGKAIDRNLETSGSISFIGQR